ncbi:hypothetical protein [Streptomyces sp. NPDC055036]
MTIDLVNAHAGRFGVEGDHRFLEGCVHGFGIGVLGTTCAVDERTECWAPVSEVKCEISWGTGDLGLLGLQGGRQVCHMADVGGGIAWLIADTKAKVCGR